MVARVSGSIYRQTELVFFFQAGLETPLIRACTQNAVHVFTGSDLITGSDRIGPEIGYLAHFLKHFFIIIMFIKNVYDHNNDVWIIKVGDDSYYLTGSGLKMVK